MPRLVLSGDNARIDLGGLTMNNTNSTRATRRGEGAVVYSLAAYRKCKTLQNRRLVYIGHHSQRLLVDPMLWLWDPPLCDVTAIKHAADRQRWDVVLLEVGSEFAHPLDILQWIGAAQAPALILVCFPEDMQKTTTQQTIKEAYRLGLLDLLRAPCTTDQFVEVLQTALFVSSLKGPRQTKVRL